MVGRIRHKRKRACDINPANPFPVWSGREDLNLRPLDPQLYSDIPVQVLFSAIWLYLLYGTDISGIAKFYLVVPVTVCLLHNYCTVGK